MGLMFARRRMDEAAKRAVNKAKAQSERHSEVKERQKAKDGPKTPKDVKDADPSAAK